MSGIQFVICDDQKLFRKGLKYSLNAHGLECAGEAANGFEALDLLEKVNADIVLCDIEMPKMNGLELIEKINEKKLSTKVLVLSGYDNNTYLMESRRAGAMGYLLKDSSEDELVLAIKKVCSGDTYFGQHVPEALFRQMENLKASYEELIKERILTKISNREYEMLEYIVKGLTNREIADVTGLSVRTIDSHRANIQDKLEAKNTADLVRIYCKGE